MTNRQSLNQLDWNELDARLSKAYSCLGGIPLAREVEEARDLIRQAQNLRAEMAIIWRRSAVEPKPSRCEICEDEAGHPVIVCDECAAEIL